MPFISVYVDAADIFEDVTDAELQAEVDRREQRKAPAGASPTTDDMLLDLGYVRRYYGVPAEIGRLVIVGSRPGIITADRGAYIGVTFDDENPTMIRPCHPTSQIIYGEMGTPRPLTRSQRRYIDYLEVADVYESFAHYLRAHRAQVSI